MCGFFLTNNPQVVPEDWSTIESCLRFRGPDCSSDLVSVGDWKAYHSRLAIIDVNSGTNQPVLDEQGGILVFNGEILNYKQLGMKYFEKEYSSDTALLSDLIVNDHLFLDEIDGFFAFVYVDGLGKLKHAARDKFGVKPLFYHKDGPFLTFSSEPNVLKTLFSLQVNSNAIAEYYATRAPLFSGSYFHGVNIVEPGCCLVSGKYFDCEDMLGGDYVEVTSSELHDAIKKGIETRLVSDAPVGLLLSRGIDSNLTREIGTFEGYYSIGFEGDEDISYLKDQKVDKLKLIECTPEDYKDEFERLLALRQEPLSVPNEVLLSIISKVAASDGIKVLLSGEGADEFFGGYDRVFNWAAQVKEFDFDSFLELYCYLTPEKNSDLYNKFKGIFENRKLSTPFELVRWFFIRYHMPVLFRRLDFSLMAAGVEGREPLANYHIFNVAVKYSSSHLMEGELGKIPLRKEIAKYMGEEFAFEKKVGFPVDLRKVYPELGEKSSYEIWFEKNLEVLK